MPVSSNSAGGPAHSTASSESSARFVTRCSCGRLWNLMIERGQPGTPGCVRCSCEAELVSWSGTIVFSAVPTEIAD